MNIVLASSPDLQTNYGGPFPPLGLLYLAGSVKHMPDVRVICVDAYSEGLNVKDSVDRILSHSPEVVGVSPTSETFHGAWGIVKEIKRARPDILTMLGGYYATIFDRLLLREIPELDMVFRGEPEHSFPQFCRRLLRGEDVAGVPGLSYRSNGEVIRGEPQRIEDLDSIPLPDRSVVDNPNRIFDWVGYVFPEVPPIATMVSSRGCPFRCNFCTPTSSFACGWRGRSAENVLQELLQLAEEGFRIVISVENNFTANVARVNKLCRMIMEHGLHKKMRFFTQGMVDHVPEATLQLMHKAGFDGIYVGVESGSDAQLKRYDKATTGRRTGDGILRTKKAHMFVISSFITGGIGETDEDREETYKFVRKIKPLVCEVGSLRVHPGTPLWDELVGPEEPATIEESLTRTIDQFPGQQDEETLKRWIKDFEKVFHGTFGRGRRLREAIDLLLHNPTARWFIKTCLKHPWVVAKIIKRMRPGD